MHTAMGSESWPALNLHRGALTECKSGSAISTSTSLEGYEPTPRILMAQGLHVSVFAIQCKWYLPNSTLNRGGDCETIEPQNI